jgi:hypothetical protein
MAISSYRSMALGMSYYWLVFRGGISSLLFANSSASVLCHPVTSHLQTIGPNNGKSAPDFVQPQRPLNTNNPHI